jgi:thiamine-monophosphate kinase
MRLSDLGELKTIELIKRITAKVNSKFIKVGIGDDACVFQDGTVVTTDAYIEDVHFSLDYFSLYEIGQRVVCGTLSDIAAMAAEPIAVFISALLPPQLEQKQLKDLYLGMQSITGKFSCEIAGGDIVAYPKIGLILTAIGKTQDAKLRSTAKPGDHLYITGYCGLSETGRLALKKKLSRKEYAQSIKRHTCPTPRINEAQNLKKYIDALIDTSDGLSTDAFHIAEESKVKIKIFADKIPIHRETKSSRPSTVDRRLYLALNGGEDYELLFTSPKDKLPSNILGTKITHIGVIEKGRGLFLVKNKQEIPLEPKGYDHFRIK